MFISCGSHSCGTNLSVIPNCAGRFNALLNNRYQVLCPGIRHSSRTDAANMVVFTLDCNKNQGFPFYTTTPFPWPFTSGIPFISFNRAGQSITAISYHGGAEYMERYPYDIVLWDYQDSIKSNGAETILSLTTYCIAQNYNWRICLVS